MTSSPTVCNCWHIFHAVWCCFWIYQFYHDRRYFHLSVVATLPFVVWITGWSRCNDTFFKSLLTILFICWPNFYCQNYFRFELQCQCLIGNFILRCPNSSVFIDSASAPKCCIIFLSRLMHCRFWNWKFEIFR